MRSFGGPNSIPPATPTAPAAIFVLVLRKALQGLMETKSKTFSVFLSG